MKELLDKLFHGKMTYKNVDAVALILLATGFVAALVILTIRGDNTNGAIEILIMLVFAAVGIWLRYLYWRCPHCEQTLPWRVLKSQMQHCPGCGHRIDWR